MLARIESVALFGSEARFIEVELHVSRGVPRLHIVGLPTKSVREAEQRVRSALASTGHAWPAQRIVANLAPGALPKDGTHFDLAIALGLLAAAARIPAGRLGGWVVVGELALDGSLRGVRGALAAALACRRGGRRGIVCPSANASEAALVTGIEVVPAASLGDCTRWAEGSWQPPAVAPARATHPPPVDDLRDVRGHPAAKRALEVTAAGGHNLLMVGAPGSGKTMLARRLPGILPELSLDEALEVTCIHSIAGLVGEGGGLVSRRPLRSPHQQVSVAGLIGGGSGLPRPGEVSLAHHGVLFLDELTLFRRDALESLRAPLEDGCVRIARTAGTVNFPCRVCLVGAMNPCSCGYLGDLRRACRCSARQVEDYRRKLSGPFLDRFDLHVAMARLDRHALLGGQEGEPSAVVRARVEAARELQSRRYGSGAVTNSSAPRGALERDLRLTGEARAELTSALEWLTLSGRGVDRVLRVARTLADLAGLSEVAADHIGEALTYRSHDGVRPAAP